MIGLVQGGIQALSRSHFANIIPQQHSVAFFGFYNMLSQYAALIGPVVIGVVAKTTGDPRWGFLSISSLFIVGAVLLCFSREKSDEVKSEV